jgi:hypothetical protein
MDASTRKKVVVAFAALAVALGFVVVSKGFAAAPPGDGYRWQQLGCAAVSSPYAQPPASVATVSAAVATYAPAASYAWGQPGCAPVTTPGAQPSAEIPIG